MPSCRRCCERAGLNLEIRGSAYTDVTADDLAWADTYIGFRRPPLPTMGNVRWVHCTGAGVDSWLATSSCRVRFFSRELRIIRDIHRQWAGAGARVSPGCSISPKHSNDMNGLRATFSYIRGSRRNRRHGRRRLAHRAALLVARRRGARRVADGSRRLGGVCLAVDRESVAVPRGNSGLADRDGAHSPRRRAELIGRDVMSACRGAVLIQCRTWSRGR